MSVPLRWQSDRLRTCARAHTHPLIGRRTRRLAAGKTRDVACTALAHGAPQVRSQSVGRERASGPGHFFRRQGNARRKPAAAAGTGAERYSQYGIGRWGTQRRTIGRQGTTVLTFPSGSSLRKRMASAEWYVQTGSSQPGSSYLQCR